MQLGLDCFIELLFRDLEVYRLALKLYSRYEAIAYKAAEDILREAIEKHMPERTASEDEADEQSDELGNRGVIDSRPINLIIGG